MKYLMQFGIIATVSFFGEVLKFVIPLAIPASVYGLVLMFLLLVFKVIRLDMVDSAADYLIAIMPVMFVPPIVGVMDSYNEISGILIKLLVITIITTFVVMVVTGTVAQLIVKIKEKNTKDGE